MTGLQRRGKDSDLRKFTLQFIIHAVRDSLLKKKKRSAGRSTGKSASDLFIQKGNSGIRG